MRTSTCAQLCYSELVMMQCAVGAPSLCDSSPRCGPPPAACSTRAMIVLSHTGLLTLIQLDVTCIRLKSVQLIIMCIVLTMMRSTPIASSMSAMSAAAMVSRLGKWRLRTLRTEHSEAAARGSAAAALTAHAAVMGE
jgi:hypothetical protein